jgi:hypothetical protein
MNPMMDAIRKIKTKKAFVQLLNFIFMSSCQVFTSECNILSAKNFPPVFIGTFAKTALSIALNTVSFQALKAAMANPAKCLKTG